MFFYNAKRVTALGAQSTAVTTPVQGYKVMIPNSILQQPIQVYASIHIGYVSTGSDISVEIIRIPV